MRDFTLNEQALITVSQTMIRLWHGGDWSKLSHSGVVNAVRCCSRLFDFVSDAQKLDTVNVVSTELCHRMGVKIGG